MNEIKDTWATYGLILRVRIEDIPKLKQNLMENTNTEIIYQRLSAMPLTIIDTVPEEYKSDRGPSE